MRRIVLLLMVCFFTCCIVRCKTQNKVEYSLGPDVSELNKKIYIERAEKGRILFKLHVPVVMAYIPKARTVYPTLPTSK